MADCASLTRDAATSNVCDDVVLINRLREVQRLTNDEFESLETKILFHVATIDRDFALAWNQTNTGNGRFSAASAVVDDFCHVLCSSLSRLADVQLKLLRLLSCMRMLRASVNAELAVHLSAETVLRQHALDCMLENALRETLQHVASRRERRATLVAGMTEIRLIREFLTREFYFLCIDDDDVITRINVRSKGRFIFTAKNFCDFSCEAADSLAFSVYNVPLRSILDAFAINVVFMRFPP